jgi:hypothetical protein
VFDYRVRFSLYCYAAYEIAYKIVYGSGETKLERKRAAKKIKQDDAIAKMAKKLFEDSN